MNVREQQSWYIEENIERFTDYTPEEAFNDKGFQNSNKMKGTNGLFQKLMVPPPKEDMGFANFLLIFSCGNSQNTLSF